MCISYALTKHYYARIAKAIKALIVLAKQLGPPGTAILQLSTYLYTYTEHRYAHTTKANNDLAELAKFSNLSRSEAFLHISTHIIRRY